MLFINKQIIVGNLGHDPEAKTAGNGQSFCRVRVATSEYLGKDEGGKTRTRTEWHTVVLWGKRADAFVKHARKGDQVHAEGPIRTREYTDAKGAAREVKEVHAEAIQWQSRTAKVDDPALGSAEGDDQATDPGIRA